MEERKLGLPSVVSTGVGLIVATSCLMSLGQGAGALGTAFIIPMALACFINICTALSMAELNALMPNLTGGLAQYTLAGMGPFVTLVTMVGGYIVCQSIAGSVECAMFGNAINTVFNTGIPSSVFCIILLVVLIIANLLGIDMFAKIQNVVVYGLIASLVIMGLMGIFGLGTGKIVTQEMNISSSFSNTFSMLGLAFFLFIGSEFVIPISKNVKNERRNIPLGMVLSLLIIFVMQTLVVLGMGRYCSWADLAENASPHIFYGNALLGYAGSIWMIVVSIFAVISTVNSAISFLSYMCAGMAKIGLMPEFFLKKNKRGAYYIGVLMIGIIMIVVNATGLSTSDALSFMITIAIVFWMVSYVIADINVLKFRKKLPKAPRNFKVPFGPVIPIIGIVGNIFMIWHIDGDAAVRTQIFTIDGIIFLILAIYAFFWCKYKLRRPLFKSIPVQEVMAMEHELYLAAHKKHRNNKNKLNKAEVER
jgi:amino acid transporter